MKSLPRALWITFTLLLAVAAIIAVREYLLLRNIQQVMNTSTTPKIAATNEERTVVEPAKTAFVTAVKRSGYGRVSARVDFAAFKKAVEKDPAILASWGTLRWKVLEDTPALCVRNLGAGTPLAPLGVRSGDCITKLDGETINQPMRNLGIWLTLAQRSSLSVETLRNGETITYSLSKN